MCNILCLGSMAVAALFAIAVYGPLGFDPAKPEGWITYTFWGIILVGTTPGLVVLLCEECKGMRRWLSRRCQITAETGGTVNRVDGSRF